MLLHDALLESECPICLQPLNYVVQPPPTRPASPLFTSSSAAASSASATPGGSGDLSASSGDFHITFAPGVLGTDATDPWHASFAITPLASEASLSRPPSTDGPAVTSAALPSAAGTSGANAASDESASGVAVLPCGHLLHFLCAMQLCEYTAQPSCPVCRSKLRSAEQLVRFGPRPRPQPALHGTGGRDDVGSNVRRQAVDADRSNASCDGQTAGQRKRRREESDVARSAYGQRADSGEASNSVTIVADEEASVPLRAAQQQQQLLVLGETSVADESATVGPAAPSAHGVRSADSAVNGPAPVPTAEGQGTLGVPAISVDVAAAPSPAPPVLGEDDIQLIGARQLPPSRAYADLLLRSTATWAERTDTLAARVAHLERSRQQLQTDCGDLSRSLSAARRRREVLLNLPASTPTRDGDFYLMRDGDASAGAAAMQSLERLRELRRLCVETRTALGEATRQLAATTRETAEARRQMDKYTRKLARLRAGEEDDIGGDTHPERKAGKLR